METILRSKTRNKVQDKKLDELFFALSDQKRRQILNLLSEQALTVGQLANELNVSLSNISKNIALLEKVNLLNKRKKGRQVFCHMNQGTWLELASYITMMADFWQRRLTNLEQYVKTGKTHGNTKQGT